MNRDPDAEKRSSPRTRSYAKVLVRRTGAAGYLRDLSLEGCQIALLAPIPPTPPGEMELQILPEVETGVAPFAVRFEACWSRSDDPYLLLGGTITPVGGAEQARSLAELLRYYS
jgi:hypothetical protein